MKNFIQYKDKVVNLGNVELITISVFTNPGIKGHAVAIHFISGKTTALRFNTKEEAHKAFGFFATAACGGERCKKQG